MSGSSSCKDLTFIPCHRNVWTWEACLGNKETFQVLLHHERATIAGMWYVYEAPKKCHLCFILLYSILIYCIIVFYSIVVFTLINHWSFVICAFNRKRALTLNSGTDREGSANLVCETVDVFFYAMRFGKWSVKLIVIVIIIIIILMRQSV